MSRADLRRLAGPVLLVAAAACAPDPVAPGAPAASSAAAALARAPRTAPGTAAVAAGETPTVPIHLATNDVGSCAVRPDGTLRCWSRDGRPAFPATRAPLRGSYRQVAVGQSASCALRDDGFVECFGERSSAIPLGRLAARAGEFVQLDVAGDHACALRDDGEAECWGGIAPGVPAVPLRTASTGRYTTLDLGGSQACALRDDGAIECWGYGPSLAGTLFTPPAGRRYEEVHAGLLGVYARDDLGQWTGWGCCGGAIEAHYTELAYFDELGVGDGVVDFAVSPDYEIGAIPLSGAVARSAGPGGATSVTATTGRFVQIGVATRGVCALRDDGFVQCGSAARAPQFPALVDVRAPQTITVAPDFTGPLPYGSVVPIAARAGSGLLLNARSLTPTICTAGGTAGAPAIFPVAATGTCRVVLSQSGNARWSPAPERTLELPVTRGTATLTVGALAHVHDGTPRAPTVTTQPAGLAVQLTFASRTSPPSAPGSYPFSARVDTPLWTGAADGVLVIEMARIDVQPARISLATSPTVTVYVHGSAIVDAARIDPATVRLRVDGGTGPGAAVALRNGAPMSTLADVDRDGRTDRMLVFRTADLVAAGLSPTRPALVLEDRTGALRLVATDPSPPQIVP